MDDACKWDFVWMFRRFYVLLLIISLKSFCEKHPSLVLLSSFWGIIIFSLETFVVSVGDDYGKKNRLGSVSPLWRFKD